MAIRWTKDLSVGVDEIDDQHKCLFQAADGLLEAMSLGKGEKEMEELVGFLENYVIEHFAAEEKYMDRYNYPAMDSHKDEHDRFMVSFSELKARVKKEGPNPLVVIQTQKWLHDWLCNHIKGVDKAFGKFLIAKLGASKTKSVSRLEPGPGL